VREEWLGDRPDQPRDPGVTNAANPNGVPSPSPAAVCIVKGFK
jgi:hypothetical protein